MQPNSNNSPLQSPHPVVPNVPEIPKVPDIPQIPQTPTAQAEPPKITGVSLPAGANKKPESPTQRSNKINEANAPKPQQQAKTENLLHKPVTMEEIDEYRRKSAKKRKIILITTLIILASGSLTSFLIYIISHSNSHTKLSHGYNENIPIIINRTDSKPLLISQNGRKLTEKYNQISPFSSDRSLATLEEGETIKNVIISNTGKQIFATENTLNKTNDGQNFIIQEEGKSYLLNKNGKKVDERPLRTMSYKNEQKYFLVADDSTYAVIDPEGNEKITGKIDKNEIKSFSYANNTMEDNYYCAFINSRKKDSKLYVYNCETAQEITNIENVYFDGGFKNANSSFLESEQGSSYFYNNQMIYNSNSRDIELIGGIIQSTKDERYFNPVTQKTSESFPSESLISQDKFKNKTSITEDCDYEKRTNSKLTKICNNIYYKNKLLNLDSNRYEYSFFNEELDDYLSFSGKHYLYKEDKTKGTLIIIDAESNKDLYTVDKKSNNLSNNSRFILTKNGDKNIVVDLISGKTAEYEKNSSITLENNYYIVRKVEDSERSVKYYNSKHKQIYTDNN